MHLLCPHCKNPIELVRLDPAAEITCTACGSSFRLADGSTTGYAPAAGSTVGRFAVLETVGQGAFGTVFKARDPELDRLVAVKVPRRGNAGDVPADVDRFLREARSVAQLRHPNIVSIHEVGTLDGNPYLVSDFVEGVTLADLLTARRPTPREAAKLVAEAADALAHAHAQGVVHRDVKPSNIMIRPDGSPVVMDFGLAKRDAGEITMTVDGQVLGTPAYMSPEQARGEGHRVDGRSDVYSLGVILYQLLTGELPFRGNVRMLLHQVLHDDPKPPRALNDKLPRDLETVGLKAMAKEPARRYGSAKDLGDDLRRWLAGEPVKARPVGRIGRVRRWARRKPMVAAAAFLGVLALAASAAAGVGFAYSHKLATAYDAEAAARADEEAQRKAAETAEARARDALRKIENVEYFNSILIAGTAVKDGRDGDALTALETCRPDLRDWEWFKLFADCHREHLSVPGSTPAFNPARDEIACADADGTVRLWDLVTGLEKAPGPAPGGKRVKVKWMAIGPSGRLGAAVGPQGIRVWQLEDGREVWTADGAYEHVVFSPDGRRVGAAGRKSGARVWEADTGREVWEADGGFDQAAFSPNGRHLAAAGPVTGVRVWEADGGRQVWKAGGSWGTVAFSPDGRHVAAAGLATGVRVWEADDGREVGNIPAATTLGGYQRVVFSPDGRHVAAAGATTGVRMWEVVGGREVWRTDGGYVRLAFSPDGRRVVAAGLGVGVRTWDAPSGREVWRADGPFLEVAFSPDGRRLAAAGPVAGVRVWEVDGGPEEWKSVGAFVGAFVHATFSPDGRRVAAGGSQGMCVYEADGGREVWKAAGDFDRVMFSSDGERVAAAGRRTGVRVWEAAGGRVLWKLDGGYTDVVFRRDARRVAVTGVPSGMHVWDVDVGREVWKADGVAGAVAFDQDGGRVATIGTHTGMRVCDADTGQELWHAEGEGEGPKEAQLALLTVGFSRDGQRIAATGLYIGVRVWDAVSGRELWRADRREQKDAAFRLGGFSPDGRHVAAVSAGQGVRVWESDSGREVWTAAGGLSASLNPSGTRMLIKTGRGFRLLEADGGREVWSPAERRYWMISFAPDGRRTAFVSDDGTELTVLGPARDLEALHAARRKAIQADPGGWHERTALGAEAAGQWFAAVFHWERLTRLDPARGDAHWHCGRALARLGRTAEATKAFEAALEQRGTLAPLSAADCHAMLDQWEAAAALFAKAAVSSPPNPTLRFWTEYASLHLAIGDLGRYRTTCQTMIERFGPKADPEASNTIAWTVALGPAAAADLKPVVDLARTAVRAAPESWGFRDTLGAILYRSGSYAEAVGELETAIRLHGKGGAPGSNAFLAMAQHRLGKKDRAETSLQQAGTLLNQDLPWSWSIKLARQLVYREATELIHPEPVPKKK